MKSKEEENAKLQDEIDEKENEIEVCFNCFGNAKHVLVGKTTINSDGII